MRTHTLKTHTYSEGDGHKLLYVEIDSLLSLCPSLFLCLSVSLAVSLAFSLSVAFLELIK